MPFITQVAIMSDPMEALAFTYGQLASVRRPPRHGLQRTCRTSRAPQLTARHPAGPAGGFLTHPDRRRWTPGRSAQYQQQRDCHPVVRLPRCRRGRRYLLQSRELRRAAAVQRVSGWFAKPNWKP